MALRLGQDGYAFAEIRAVPELNEETKQAVDHVLRRSAQSRLRSPHQLQRRRQRQ